MPGSLATYVAQHTRPLPSLAELGAAPEALAPLTEMLAGARIVAIGESFHHTHEQLVLREHLVRHLVSQLGYDTILLEVITPGPNAIDAYVQGGGGSVEEALITAGARMWRNRETASLMRWLRAYNAEHDGAVSVGGLDVMAIGPLMRAVAGTGAIAETERVTTLSEGFNIDGRADQIAYNKLGTDERALLRRVFRQAHSALSSRADAPVASEQALVVAQALEMLDAGTQGWLAGFALRDTAMAGAAVRSMAGSERRKAVILSHNTHIAALAPNGNPSHPPMGAHLREHLGRAYFALGTTFGRARFDPPIYGVGDLPSEPGTADHAMASLQHPTSLADLRGAPQEEPLRVQGVGAGPEPYTEYPRPAAFDALIYVDALTNAQQLVETELTMDVNAIDATRS